jgi:hypothetical protein
MLLDNISIKMTLNQEYKTKPFFSLEQVKEYTTKVNNDCQIFKIKPEKTDIKDILDLHSAYLIILKEDNRFRAYDNDGSFIISEKTITESLDLLP